MYNIVVVIAALIIFFPTLSYSGGPVHGAKASGMGTAFIAVADDPSAIMINPAGLTQLKGTNIYGGTTFLIPSTEYEGPAGETEETESQIFFPPHFYISSDLGREDLVFGLGIYAPFGIGGRKWSDTGIMRYLSVENFTATFSINPTIAWQALPGLSVAAGVNYVGALSKAEVMVDQSVFGAGDAKQELDGLGYDWGYNFGLLYLINDELSLGIQYRSEVVVDQSGDVTINNIAPALQPQFGGSSFKTEVDTRSVFPQIFGIGIAYRPNSKLTLAFDAEWFGWSASDETTFDYKTEVPAAGFTDMTMPTDSKDVWSYKAGAEYKINSSLSVRGGYAYIESFVPEHTLTPSMPDSDQHNFSLGAGYVIDQWTIDGFYNGGFFEDRTVNNNILSGEYKNIIHYAGLSVGHRF